jgi:hypothetical protein
MQKSTSVGPHSVYVMQLAEALRYNQGRSRVRFLIVSLKFFIDIIH